MQTMNDTIASLKKSSPQTRTTTPARPKLKQLKKTQKQNISSFDITSIVFSIKKLNIDSKMDCVNYWLDFNLTKNYLDEKTVAQYEWNNAYELKSNINLIQYKNSPIAI